MRRISDTHRLVLLVAALAFVPALGTVAVGWTRVLTVLEIVMAILAFLLVLKAAFVALSVGIRLVR